MTGGLASLILLTGLSLGQTTGFSQQISLTVAEFGQELHQTDIVLGALLTGCIIVIVALILYTKLKPVYEHCKGTGEVTTSSHAEHNSSAEEQLSCVVNI
ncbi:hypothetical protein INR49_013542 [Caranx melampygus]|nr:hypothetical protein INR49_013542 [Caranx melampygus]